MTNSKKQNQTMQYPYISCIPKDDWYYTQQWVRVKTYQDFINALHDYNTMLNRPKIEGKTLMGNNSLEELGIASKEDTYTKQEVNQIIGEKQGLSVHQIGEQLLFLPI